MVGVLGLCLALGPPHKLCCGVNKVTGVMPFSLLLLWSLCEGVSSTDLSKEATVPQPLRGWDVGSLCGVLQSLGCLRTLEDMTPPSAQVHSGAHYVAMT